MNALVRTTRPAPPDRGPALLKPGWRAESKACFAVMLVFAIALTYHTASQSPAFPTHSRDCSLPVPDPLGTAWSSGSTDQRLAAIRSGNPVH
ncbi:hypothetical protein BD414DRAFT_495780 [Trametes punicea]|nr:hypothetical protein BD414DRAFT_495780 [Trametes punicea]